MDLVELHGRLGLLVSNKRDTAWVVMICRVQMVQLKTVEPIYVFESTCREPVGAKWPW